MVKDIYPGFVELTLERTRYSEGFTTGNPELMTSRNRIIFFAAASASLASGAAILVALWRWRRSLLHRISELEEALETSLVQRAAERRGRIRAQQDLRKALVDKDTSDGANASYPMVPIGFIESCFSTRNGTPRQPLLVPLARACLTLSPGGVPATAFDGLAEYSHCWLLYVFHANTDLPHIWKQPNHKDFKAKVRVPRLDGGKLGVYATRSPHRPCPIGLTVAKVEGVHGRMLLISGADLVDGTPVLDVKPYLPFCDSIPTAVAPLWVKAGGEDDPIALASVQFSPKFVDDFSKRWEILGKQSMYSSPSEFQNLIKQVLSKDIRSLRQRTNPRNSLVGVAEEVAFAAGPGMTAQEDQLPNGNSIGSGALPRSTRHSHDNINGPSNLVLYKLILEGLIIMYSVNDGHVTVHGTEISDSRRSITRECSSTTWTKVTKSSQLQRHNVDH